MNSNQTLTNLKTRQRNLLNDNQSFKEATNNLADSLQEPLYNLNKSLDDLRTTYTYFHRASKPIKEIQKQINLLHNLMNNFD